MSTDRLHRHSDWQYHRHSERSEESALRATQSGRGSPGGVFARVPFWRKRLPSRLWRSAMILLITGVVCGSPRFLVAQSDSFPVEEVTEPVSPPVLEVGDDTAAPADTMATTATQAASGSIGSSDVASDPLPTPSHRRAYLHLFLAFGVAWVLIFSYVIFLDRRIRQARRELERMEGR